MRFGSRIAVGILLLAALGPAPADAQQAARRLPKPPGSEDREYRTAARWIPKDPPPAPLPSSVTAPAPRPPLIPFPDDLPSQAAGPGKTLAELEEIALANNPTLAQAMMRVEAAKGKCLQEGLYPNPVIGYEAEEIGIDGSAGQQGMFLGQEIITAGKLGLRTAVVAQEIEQAQHAWESQRARVLNDLRSAWYEVLVAQRMVQLNEQLVLIGEEGVKAASTLVESMEVSRVDVLQARIEADSTRLQLYDARNRYQAAWRRLAAVLGTPDMDPTPLAGELEEDLPRLTFEDALRDLLCLSPELAEAQAAARRARCAVARECAAWVPDVDVRAGVRYHDADHHAVAALEVGLPLPLFNRNQGNICKAEAEVIAAEYEVQRVELVLRRRLAAAFQRYSKARNDAAQYAAQILPNARKSLGLVQQDYRDGKADYLTLLTAQRTYFEASLAYLEGLLQCRASAVEIEGFLLRGGLEPQQRPHR